MLCFKRLNVLASSSRRPFFCSSWRTVSAITTPVARRTLSTALGTQGDIFNYTSGRWVYNEALRLKERRAAFNVDGLKQLAAQAVGRSPEEVSGLSMHAEGNSHRTLIITFSDGRQMICRIPYPITVPTYHTVASEAATMEYMRSSGVPVPKIYGYSPESANAAGTAYIFMEHIQGTRFNELWPRLDDREIISIIDQLTQLEARMMALAFPAGGSLFFAEDLERVAPGLGILLDDSRFCIGPDLWHWLWHGRREQIVVDRGPYKTAEVAFVAGAYKELAYLKQFGRPILPFYRGRRGCYNFHEQQPSDHVENLNRFLSVAPALIPQDPLLTRFCIQHPCMELDQVIVSRSPITAEYEVAGLVGWQRTSILPAFLQGGLYQGVQNEKRDEDDQALLEMPSLPEDFSQMEADEQEYEAILYRRNLIQHRIAEGTKKHNPHHYSTLTNPLYALRHRLFHQAGVPWGGETFDLKFELIQTMKKWEALTTAQGDKPVSCPIAFDAQDLNDTAELYEKVKRADTYSMYMQGFSRVGEAGWVLPEDYEYAMKFLKESREDALEDAQSLDQRNGVLNHWPWDDMDETDWM